jgi:N-carbamoyl-L-amino-acid hydrolase
VLLSELRDIGRDPAGGVTRFAWTTPELTLREWFAGRAAALGLDAETDGNGNLWAWWNASLPGPAFAIGSHLDSVPGGGDWDGPSPWSPSPTRRAAASASPVSVPEC